MHVRVFFLVYAILMLGLTKTVSKAGPYGLELLNF